MTFWMDMLQLGTHRSNTKEPGSPCNSSKSLEGPAGNGRYAHNVNCAFSSLKVLANSVYGDDAPESRTAAHHPAPALGVRATTAGGTMLGRTGVSAAGFCQTERLVAASGCRHRWARSQRLRSRIIRPTYATVSG